MKILIIGNGGREHALAWKCAQSDNVSQVFVAPGNAGTANEGKVSNVAIDVLDNKGLLNFAQTENIDLTIVGPEAPLVNALVDDFNFANLKCFGPTQNAAQLEGSKAFTKDFLARHNIPTAAYENFTEIDPAVAYIKKHGAPIVVKADGLAAGKGVIVAQTEQQAIDAVHDMLAENRFGDAGSRVVIEEFLTGEEASFICMVDGSNILAMASSQDHKARDEGDKGPNTGGMGAYSPAPVVTEAVHQKIMEQVMRPTVDGMAAEGNTYLGFLYAGVMVDDHNNIKVLEFNCRFGDPETQPIMMRLQSDLPALCLAAIDGQLNEQSIQWDKRAALGVVIASGGYPDSYTKGFAISGLDSAQADQKIFIAGAESKNGQIINTGGRVLCVCALGDTVSEAQQKAYQLAEKVNWNGAFYRSDIGYRAVNREK
jgi:phosphoribosylamine--glycine ligase